MEDDLITTKEVGDYRIKVYYCHDSECPITCLLYTSPSPRDRG